MINQVQVFVAEQTAALSHQVKKVGQESVETVRGVAIGSAESLKSLKAPVRSIARSGIKATAVSQNAVASLIELQSDVVTAAIADAALRLERASRASSVVELVREQFEMIPATRARFVEDVERAVAIVKLAGRDLRGVAVKLYERVVETGEEKLPAARRKVVRAKRAPAAKTRTPRVAKVATVAEAA